MAKNSPRRLYVKNTEAWEKNLSKKRFSDRQLEVKVVERGIILPARPFKGTWEGGVHDSDFNFVAGYSRRKPSPQRAKSNSWACCESGYSVNRKEIVHFDEDVIFGGALIGRFGHFFLECFCRLWYVVQNPALKSKVAFILLKGGHKSWYDDFFRLMGIDKERIIYVEKPMQFRSVTVPDQSQYYAGSFTKEFLLPYRAIQSRVTPGKLKKLYLTRTDFDEKYLTWANADEENFPSRGVCFNEKYFEDKFREWGGVNIISPETLSVEEQISLIMGADEIVSTLGTLSNLAIFCKPNAKFIVLNRAHTPVEFQFLVNEAVNLNDFYAVDVSRDFMYKVHANSACMLGSNKYWKAFAADYFGKQIDEDDDKEYFDEALEKYVDFWYKKYSGEKDKVIDSLKTMCKKIYKLEVQISKNRSSLSYQTHVAAKGWGTWIYENLPSNSIDKKRDIQAIKINFPNHDVYYSVYFNDKEGWSEEVKSPEQAGTTGKGKPIFGVKIRLNEADAKNFDILYRVHKFNGEWTDWAKNGEEIISRGVKLNAIQIKLEMIKS